MTPTERRYEHYAFASIADGVTAGIARADGTALSNTGVVELGGLTAVFDTSLTLRSARETRAAAVERTGRAPAIVVNSHWHLDHVIGNQEFEDGAIWASRGTLEKMLAMRAEHDRELAPRTLESDLAKLESERAAAPRAAARARYDGPIRIHRALLAEAVELRLATPSATFDGEVTLPGAAGARLITFGAAHTDSDTFLWLPERRVLFGGDVVVTDHHPNFGSGDPDHWLEVLDHLRALGPEQIVPGHGPVRGPEALDAVQDYLETVLRLAEASATPDLPARFRSWGMDEMFQENVEFARRRSTARRS